jgi:hypothetical protein
MSDRRLFLSTSRNADETFFGKLIESRLHGRLSMPWSWWPRLSAQTARVDDRTLVRALDCGDVGLRDFR